VCPYDLVFQAEMKEIHDLFLGCAFVGKKVLDCVNIVHVPLQFQALRGTLGPSKLDLIFLPKHGSVQEIIDPFVVNLHEGNVYGDFSVAISTGLLYLTK